MLESYRVGAIFELRDEVSPKLRGIFENVERLEKAIGRVQKAFSSINQVALGGFTEKLSGIGEKLTAIGTKAEGIGSKMRSGLQSADAAITASGRKLEGYSGGFSAIENASRTAGEAVSGNIGRATTAVGEATSAVGRMNEALRQAGESSRGIARIPNMGGGSGGGGGGGPRHGLGDNGAADRHSRIQTEHGDRPNLSGPHGAFVDAGMFGMIGGHEVAQAVERSLHRGMELTHVQSQMGQAGIDAPDIARATAGAWKEARTYGLDVSKVLGDIKELVLPFGSVNHAIEFIEPLEKMRVVLNAVSEGRGNESSEAVYKMARAGELKGLNNAEDYIRYFDGMTKAISASGGKVTPNGFAQVTQYGKLASQGWSEDFYTKSLPTLMQTMNPSTAGQSLMSLFNTLESGAVSKRSFGQMSDLGLIGDESKVEYEGGKYKGLRPGAIVGSDLLAQNPLEWARQFLTPLLEKKFGDLSDDKNKLSAIENLGGLFGNRNSAAAVAELALRTKSFDRDKGLIEQAHGVEGANALLKNDPTTAMNNFTAAWTNMLTAFGLSSVSTAVGMMNTLALSMNKIGEMAQAHPDAVKNIEGALAGIAVGLGALALVGLAVFAPGGVAIVAMTALGGALAGFIAVHWDQVEAAAKSLGLSMDNFRKNVADIGAVFDSLNAALTKFFTGLTSAFSVLPNLLSHGGGEAPMGQDEKNWRNQHYGQEPPSGLFHHTSFGGFDNDNGASGSMVDTLAMGVFKGLTMYASGGGAAGGMGGGGGGGGIINASYGGGGLGGGFTGSAFAPAGASGVGGKTGGVNPVLLAMVHRASEIAGTPLSVYSGYRSPEHNAAVGGAGNSLHMKGYASDLIAPGHSKSDGAFWARVNGAMGQAAREMHQPYRWGGTFGGRYARDNDHFDLTPNGPSREAIEALRHRSMPTVTEPSRKVAPGVPAAGGMSAMNMPPIVINHQTVLDGKVVAKAVTKHQVVAGRFPTSGGGPDMHSHYSNAAGTPVTDAA